METASDLAMPQTELPPAGLEVVASHKMFSIRTAERVAYYLITVAGLVALIWLLRR